MNEKNNVSHLRRFYRTKSPIVLRLSKTGIARRGTCWSEERECFTFGSKRKCERNQIIEKIAQSETVNLIMRIKNETRN